MSVSLSKQRSQVGNAGKQHKRAPSPETRAALDEARRDLAAAKLESYVAEVLATAPELSASQKAAIGALLQGATS